MLSFIWKNLSVKLTLIITFVIVITVVSTTLLSLKREEEAFRIELEQQAKVLLETLTAAAADPLYTLDADFLSDMMEGLGSNQLVVAGRVYDQNGRIVADAVDQSVTFRFEPDPFGQRIIASDSIVFEWQLDQLLAGKVVLAGHERLGAVSVCLSTTQLQAKMAAVSFQGLGVALVAIAIGSLVALALLQRWMVRPIKVLSRAANRVAAGNLDQTLQVSSRDEIGNLQAVFNQMIHDLREQRTAFEQRTAAEKARAAAEQANRAKSAFLAAMSHELRTPLTAILGYSELLQIETRDLDLTTIGQDVERIEQAGRHLLHLVDDVLDFTKIEAGKMELVTETFDVSMLVNDVAMISQPLIKKNDNLLEVHCDAELGTMHSDPTKIRQVLLNVLSNAAKFTEHGVISLHVSRDKEANGDWILFQVDDTGVGMSPEQVQGLFQEFGQPSTAMTAKYGGIGLGLAISRRLCWLMGGDMTVVSALDYGSSFTIRLPALVDESQCNIDTLVSNPTLNGIVLVISSDASVRDTIACSLSRTELTPMPAASKYEGVRLAKDLHPNAIILDLCLPEGDSWQTLITLKADPNLVDIPLITVAIAQQRKVGFTLSGLDYLTEPIDQARLTELLQKISSVRVMGAAQNPQTKRSLIVSGDPTRRAALLHTCEQAQWRVDVVETGQAALERLTNFNPELILLDLILPESDGIWFVNTLRSIETKQTIPVVIVLSSELTATEQQRLTNSVEQILQNGARDLPDLLSEICDVREFSRF
ncbi:MAG: ATP-binding protein [Chloroflexales bacterium]|nr:ATP-binding protein [Chloroflexales bacterium]